MTPTARIRLFVLLSALVLLLAGCGGSHFEPPETQGSPLMVADGGQPRLFVLTKQEEEQTVGIGGSRRSTGSWRTDTYYHFAVQAFDPATAKPLWTQRLLTLGDPDAKNRYQLQTRVIGSSVGASLLGQDGDVVWLLIGDEPFAVKVSDGSIVSDPATLQAAYPQLEGLLPSEAQHYGFDRGLVVRTADAQQWRISAADGTAVAHVPTPVPSPYPEGRLKANGHREMVPMFPYGDIPSRQVMLDGQWLGLYSEKEAADAADDTWGNNLLYPYQVLDEGALARRTFWRAKIVAEQNFDDRFDRLSDLTPIAGAPLYLKGRFLKDLATGMPGTPLLLDDPAGVLVWHSTRMDDAGRLALARLDTGLKEVWKTELPLSESGTANQIMYWHLPGHIVAMGLLQTEESGVTSRTPHLVSVDLADGSLAAWNMTREAPVP